MKSVAGSVLTLIDGIISALIAFLFLVVSFVFFIDPGILYIEDLGVSQYFVGSVIFTVFVLFGIIAWAKIYCAKLMNDPKTTRSGGIIALIIGIITLGIPSIVGGIFGIVQGKENEEIKQTEEKRIRKKPRKRK